MRRNSIAYSEGELRFVQARGSMPRAKLHAAFVARFARTDVSVNDIKALCSRKGWATRARWRPDEDALLRALYADTPTKKVAERLGRSLATTYHRAHRLGLEKSAAYLASPEAYRLNGQNPASLAHRFTKGQVPANKGLRRPGWAPGRMKETQFRKGERSGVATKLYKPVGTERLSKNGYLERKVNDGLPLQKRWRAVHLLRWEEANGPIPTGCALKCLGDKRDTDPANWTLVPRAILPRLNGKYGRDFDSAPAELKPAILATAKLEHAANEASGMTAVQRMIKKRKARQRSKREGRVA